MVKYGDGSPGGADILMIYMGFAPYVFKKGANCGPRDIS